MTIGRCQDAPAADTYISPGVASNLSNMQCPFGFRYSNDIGGLVQVWSNSIAYALGLLQFFNKPSMIKRIDSHLVLELTCKNN